VTNSAQPSQAFHVMVKPRGPICNLDCAYCYYLSKKNLYPGSDFRLSDEVLESFTRQYIESQHVPELTIGWQGGEPMLMGLDFYRRAVALQQDLRRPGVRIVNTLQTNGTLIDDAWGQFLYDNDFLVGLSLDGPQPLHDAYRRDKGGAATFDRVMRGLAVLQKHNVEYNLLTTVHAANVGHPLDVYRFFRDEVGARFVQFVPIVKPDTKTGSQEGSEVTDHSVTGEQYGRFLTTIFDEWVRRDVGRVFVQIFDVALAAWSAQRPGLCIFEPTCGLALVLEHNGDLYACDHFVEPRYRLGNILRTPLVELVGSEQQRRFGQGKRDGLPRMCQECEVRFVCNGGCPKNRLLRTPSGETGLNYLCAGYKSFFTHIDRPMRMMVEELRARRPPANVMLRLAQEKTEFERRFTAVGRNDPCPCGSGLKFKRCHGRKDRVAR
jgi:uncharacterized protein